MLVRARVISGSGSLRSVEYDVDNVTTGHKIMFHFSVNFRCYYASSQRCTILLDRVHDFTILSVAPDELAELNEPPATHEEELSDSRVVFFFYLFRLVRYGFSFLGELFFRVVPGFF